MDVGVAGPTIPEQCAGEKQTAGDGEIQPGLRYGFSFGLLVAVGGSEVQFVLVRVDDCADDRADRKGELDK